MSVLEFISSIKWPVTVLLLAGWVSWRTKRNPEGSRYLKDLIDRRNVRLNIVGQEIELSGVQEQAEAAALAATATDAELADATQGVEGDVVDVSLIRREAVEDAMKQAAMLGWISGAAGDKRPPGLTLGWQNDGQPYLITVINRPPQTAEQVARADAVLRAARRARERSNHTDGERPTPL